MREIRVEPGDTPVTVRVPDRVPAERRRGVLLVISRADDGDATPARCSQCGRVHAAAGPFEIATLDAGQSVCPGCARRMDPQLHWMLRTYLDFGGAGGGT